MNHIVHKLTLIHRKLDDEIRRELKHRFPSDFRLLRLKKLKLLVKDRLSGHMVGSRSARA
ncbi:DUF465 domain-containing protein [Novosphingobium sp. G106]|uniref:DUF465 domain-containing protein n=1 Tax=Novosphingobium sp. G106 TaxID=2849500 RepID=UPI001C2CDE33|nr:DUF465 domain-containing protein [Novosphingobium sp. G106]MBV1688416.1 DUF465 domain-containing protein [Novosphingobium sp. G106]